MSVSNQFSFRVAVILVLSLAPFLGHGQLLTAEGSSGASSDRRDVLARGSERLARVSPVVGATRQVSALEAYGKLPLSFEANQGQAVAAVRFLTRGRDHLLLLASSEIVLFLGAGPTEPSQQEWPGPSTVRMRFLRANPETSLIGLSELPGKVNVLTGADQKSWHTNIPTFAEVKYESLYPGIDWICYGQHGKLAYRIVVAPGSDPSSIGLAFEGAEQADLDRDGSLSLRLAAGRLRLDGPSLHQGAGDSRREVAGRFVRTGPTEVGLSVGAYDTSIPLFLEGVLDTVTLNSGLSGALGSPVSVAVDARGNLFVADTVLSWGPSPGLPLGAQSGGTPSGREPMNSSDVFVAKLDPDGSSVVYTTYLGGSADDASASIAVNTEGGPYVTGLTRSMDFPTFNAHQPAPGGSSDAFALKLSPDGSEFVYSTFLGGKNDDAASDVALDANGNAYVTGRTTSSDFPTTAGAAQPALRGSGGDAFVAKLDTTGQDLTYATYVGGSDEDASLSVVVDSEGSACLSGFARSSDFPILNAYQTALRGSSDAFIAKLSRDGSEFVYSTFLGGENDDAANDVALDSDGNMYVTGHTSSADFPTTDRAVQRSLRGPGDAFVTKLNAMGQALTYSTYLGGRGEDASLGVAVDSEGFAYLTGRTTSTDFPILNAYQPALEGSADAFVVKLTADGSGLVYATYGGGSGEEEGSGIAVDSAGNVSVVGTATSTQEFPFGILQPASGSFAFVTRLTDSFPSQQQAYSCPGTINFDNSATTCLWQTATNWDQDRLPNSTDDVCIPSVVPNGGCPSGVTLSAGTQTIRSLDCFRAMIISAGSLAMSSPSQIGQTFTLSGTGALAATGGAVFLGAVNMSAGTLTGTGDIELRSPFSLSGGTLTGSGDVGIADSFTWTGGTMSGAGTTNASAGIAISGAATKTLRGSRILTNAWTATWAQTGAGYLQVAEGSVINNTGTWDSQSDAILFDGNLTGSSTFVNTGTLKKSVGTGTTEVRIALTNSGTVAVQLGTLNLTGGSRSSGAFTETTGTTLQFGSGTHDLDSGSSIGGTGTVLVSSPAVLNVNAGSNYNVVGKTDLTNGTLYVNSGGSAISATFNQSGGTLGGSGTLTVPGVFNWTAGEQTGGGTTTASAVMTISGGATKTLRGSRTLTNSGTATWTQTGAGYLQVAEGSVINNTGTWNAQSDAILWNANFLGSSTFLNAGTFSKAAGSGTTEVRISLINSGTTTVQSGTLNLTGGSRSTGAFTSGASGATLQFGSGTHDLDSGSSIGGTGTVLVSSPAVLNVNAGSNYNVVGKTDLTNGTLYVNSGGSAISATFNQSGGTLGGSGTLTVPGVFNWTAGEQTGGGTTTASAVMTISGGATKTLRGSRTLTNSGTATWTQTGAGYLQVAEGSVINNTGTWNAQSDAILWNANFLGSSTFLNAGTFRKAAGSVTTEVRIPLINSGITSAESGTLSFTSITTDSGYIQTAGVTRLLNGALLQATSPFHIQHGTIEGIGTITGSVYSAGTLSPGSSPAPASLNINGSYAQSSGGATNVELGGLLPGSQFDQVNITGSAALSGSLQVSLIGGFTPSAGDTFTIMTFASRNGIFNGTDLPPLSAGLDWCMTYGATSIVLAVVGSDPDADCDGDGVPNALDCAPLDPTAFALPSEVGGVGFLANKSTLRWDSVSSSAGSGTDYDVARGLLSELPVGPVQGDASEVCVASGAPSASIVDLSTPGLGQGFWYLVRSMNACGASAYGHQSNGLEEITGTCP